MEKESHTTRAKTGVPEHIEIKKLTMPQFLSQASKKFPTRQALQFMGRNISFAELEKLVHCFASALVAIGVKKGDRVALLMPNIPQTVIAFYAVWEMGGIPVPNNPLYTDKELEHQLNDSGSTTIVALDLFFPRLQALRSKTSLKNIVVAHINDYLPFPLKQVFPFVKKGMYLKYQRRPDCYQFLDLVKMGSPDFASTSLEWDGVASIFYTGGTTGKSKGVVMSHAGISSMAMVLQARCPKNMSLLSSFRSRPLEKFLGGN